MKNNVSRSMKSLYRPGQRWYSFAATRLLKPKIQKFAEKDDNVKRFLVEFGKIDQSRFKDYARSTSIETTINDAIAIENEFKIHLPLIRDYSYLYYNVYSRVFSVNPHTNNVYIKQAEKIEQMKSNPSYYDSYLKAYNKWKQINRPLFRDQLKNFMSSPHDVTKVEFAMDTLFYGGDEAKKNNPEVVGNNAKSYYHANVLFDDQQESPLEAISLFIPPSKKILLNTIEINDENESLIIYKSQGDGLLAMLWMGLITNEECAILTNFTAVMSESMVKI